MFHESCNALHHNKNSSHNFLAHNHIESQRQRDMLSTVMKIIDPLLPTISSSTVKSLCIVCCSSDEIGKKNMYEKHEHLNRIQCVVVNVDHNYFMACQSAYAVYTHIYILVNNGGELGFYYA